MNSISTRKCLDVLFTCLRIALGGVFVAAAAPKILHPIEFANSLNAYRILPQFALGITAWLLPWMECILGVLLATGYCMRLSLTVAGILLLVFLAAVASAMVRGLNIDCGCFGRHEAVGWSVVARDVTTISGLAICRLYYRHLTVQTID